MGHYSSVTGKLVYRKDPDCVGGARPLSPAGYDHHVVPGLDEAAPLAEVDGVLDPGVHVVHPSALRPRRLVQQRDGAAEDLELSRHLRMSKSSQREIFCRRKN